MSEITRLVHPVFVSTRSVVDAHSGRPVRDAVQLVWLFLRQSPLHAAIFVTFTIFGSAAQLALLLAISRANQGEEVHVTIIGGLVVSAVAVGIASGAYRSMLALRMEAVLRSIVGAEGSVAQTHTRDIPDVLSMTTSALAIVGIILSMVYTIVCITTIEPILLLYLVVVPFVLPLVKLRRTIYSGPIKKERRTRRVMLDALNRSASRWPVAVRMHQLRRLNLLRLGIAYQLVVLAAVSATFAAFLYGCAVFAGIGEAQLLFAVLIVIRTYVESASLDSHVLAIVRGQVSLNALRPLLKAKD